MGDTVKTKNRLNEESMITLRREVLSEVCAGLICRHLNDEGGNIPLNELIDIKQRIFTSSFDSMEKLDALSDYLKIKEQND